MKDEEIRNEAVRRLVSKYYSEYVKLIDELEKEWKKYGGILK